MKIFISYSRRDAGDFANQIHESLMDEHQVFTDVKNIQLGDIWNSTIEKNISTCDIFVVIVTFAALKSQEVEKEVLQALKEKKKIIPCFHKDIIDSDIKWGLDKIQGVEFYDKYELARIIALKITISLSNATLNKPENTPTIKEETKITNSILMELKNNHKNIMNNFNKIRSDIVKFDLDIPADRLLFYLRLLEYLTNSNEVFLNQTRIQYMLEDSLRKWDYTIPKSMGYDEFFYKTHSKMTDEERDMFNFLRQTTEDSKLLNSFARRLLQDNLEIFNDMSELKLLYEHYSYWLAKYELLKNDPDMCLIYLAPRQNKGFPTGIELRINEKIKALREETIMQDLP